LRRPKLGSRALRFQRGAWYFACVMPLSNEEILQSVQQRLMGLSQHRTSGSSSISCPGLRDSEVSTNAGSPALTYLTPATTPTASCRDFSLSRAEMPPMPDPRLAEDMDEPNPKLQMGWKTRETPYLGMDFQCEEDASTTCGETVYTATPCTSQAPSPPFSIEAPSFYTATPSSSQAPFPPFSIEAPSPVGRKESEFRLAFPTRQELLDEFLQPLRRQTELLEELRVESQQEAQMLAVLVNPAKFLAQPGITGLAAHVSEMAWSAEYGDFSRSRVAVAEKTRRNSLALQVLQEQGSDYATGAIGAMGPPVDTMAYQVHDDLRRRLLF